MWKVIKYYRESWGNLKLEHVFSHMDEHLDDEDLLPECKKNIMADHLADAYQEHHKDSTQLQLTDGLPGFLHHRGVPVPVPVRRWAKEKVAMLRSKQRFAKHGETLTNGIEIDWASTLGAVKANNALWTLAAEASYGNNVATARLPSHQWYNARSVTDVLL